jgi:O-acetyl-ADP-ribose deacetylase (regulator of RNase III)
MEDVESGLLDLVDVIRRYDIRSIAVPPLGSGLGGLDWKDVKPRVASALEALPDVAALVYEPAGAPSSGSIARNREVPRMTAGRAALVELMSRYLKGLLDPVVSLLEVHKLMYFMQEAGEPLRLNFKPAHYGPYAENLRHVLNAVEGHLVSGYADGGDAPEKTLELVPGAVDEANRFLVGYAETRGRFDRVADLVEGFESAYGLELLSTVHWVAKSVDKWTSEKIARGVYDWNDRKRQFTRRQIDLAMDVLLKKGWIEPSLATA